MPKISDLTAATSFAAADVIPIVQSGETKKLRMDAFTSNARTAAEIAAGVTPSDYGYPPGDVRRYAAGDGVTNDTAALQAAINASTGAALDFGSGLTFLVTATLTLASNSQYVGSSAIKANAAIAGAVLDASSKSGVTIDGLEIDGNGDGSGANYGAQFSAGSDNTITNCNIHDTIQAGIRAASETALKVVNNRLADCGRDGYTDNHGIMVYATTGTLSGVQISGNTVTNAYRKGIATYSASPGVVRGVVISGNNVSGCGLGGIYVGNAAGADAQQDVSIVNNRCSANYVNIEADDLVAGLVDGNVCNGTTGGQGMYSSDCLYTVISNNAVYDSEADGIKVIGTDLTPVGLTVTGNVVALSSQAGEGTYNGIDLTGVTYSSITGNVILGESASPKQGYGIEENGACDYNLYAGNHIANTHTGTLAVYLGANNSIQESGSFTGTLTGCTTSPTGSIEYSISGDFVTLEIPAISGTSNTTAATITGMPVALRPAAAQTALGITTDNGTAAISKIVVETSGTLTLHNALSATFTGSGTKGVAACSITYRVG